MRGAGSLQCAERVHCCSLQTMLLLLAWSLVVVCLCVRILKRAAAVATVGAQRCMLLSLLLLLLLRFVPRREQIGSRSDWPMRSVGRRRPLLLSDHALGLLLLL